MAHNIIEQFTTMLNTRFSLGNKPDPPRKAKRPIRETITYPKIKVGADNDSCLDSSLSFEHVLACGHIVTTALPCEPCAPNCHHVTDKQGDLDRPLRIKRAMNTKNGKSVSTEEFYCDACVETEIEAEIPAEFSASNAEERRTMLRANEAKALGKTARYRKCYIGLKITSVPCHSDGSVSSRYKPREERHPFDMATPQTGENMFEDIDPNPSSEEGNLQEVAKKKLQSVVDIDDDTDMEDDARILSGEDEDENGRPRGTIPTESVRLSRVAARAQRLAAAVARPSPGNAGRTRAGPPVDSLMNGQNAAPTRVSLKRKNRRVIEDGNEDEDKEEEEEAPPTKRK